MNHSIHPALAQNCDATLFEIAARMDGSELPKVIMQSFAERMFAIVRADAANFGRTKKSPRPVSTSRNF